MSKKISETKALELYDEFLDKTCEPFRVGQLEYLPSETLKEVDPIAYRVGFTDWLDAEELKLKD